MRSVESLSEHSSNPLNAFELLQEGLIALCGLHVVAHLQLKQWFGVDAKSSLKEQGCVFS